ncbi:MAG: 4-hydroxythreonine-4-phosphate dehydrogenase PdxA [Cyanobacteriota bacterium]
MSPATSPVKLALTLGDPLGIGPEIILKALAQPEVQACGPVTVIGDRQVLETTYQLLKAKTAAPLADPAHLSIWDCDTGFRLYASELSQGYPGGNPDSGAASFIYLKTAIEQTLRGHFQAIVTAPIAKYLWQEAGYRFPGQTEALAQFSSSERYGMVFVARSPFSYWQLRVLLATTHIPLRNVPEILTPDLLQDKLDLLVETLRQTFGISDPVIAVAGLNPHAGEQGQLGQEEQHWLTPLLQTYPKAQIWGPIPADTMWLSPAQAWYNSGATAVADAYVALYHDQGLIPVKMLAFDQAVNLTIGLPFIRTSPDHGTAFDIAGKGVARADSLKQAILLAAELLNNSEKNRQKL